VGIVQTLPGFCHHILVIYWFYGVFFILFDVLFIPDSFIVDLVWHMMFPLTQK